MEKIRNNKKQIQRAKYVALDIVSVLVSWLLFFIFRRLEIESSFIQEIKLFSPIYNFEKLLLGIPIYWIFIFWLSGYYNKPFRKSRLTEFVQTFVSILFGSVGLFFLLLLDDKVVHYTDYYLSFIVLFVIYFFVVYLFRYFLTRSITYKIHNRICGFNTLIIGTGENAEKIYDQLQNLKKSTGNLICGFVSENKNPISKVDKKMILGGLPDINRIMKEYEVEEVIVAIDSDEKEDLFFIINQLYKFDIDIRITPKLYDFLVGGVRLSVIYGMPLVDVLDIRLSDWEMNVKRLFDITFSSCVLLFASPLLMYLAIRVKCSSKGPVLYKQERIGQHGRPFTIFKFRTMFVNAEAGVPQLATLDDSRITSLGRKMRKYRLDELPQFFNVLIGDMSIVGPRPERAYFENRILQKAPYFSLLHKIRPGITSWGMVKYGYADSVEKMIERLKYDIIYLENISLIVDLKIMIYTVHTVLTGKGV